MLGQRDMTLDDYVAILRRRWILIAVLGVVGSAVGFGVAHFIPKKYTSQTLVLVQQPTVPGDYVKPVVSDATGARLATMQQEILSRSRLEPIIQQFGLFREDIDKVPMEDLVGRLRGTIAVTPVQAMAETRAEGLPGFTVSVTFPDPALAQKICTSITSLFIEENGKLRQQQAEQTTDFIGGQLVDAKTKLDQQDAKLADFQRRYMGSLPDDEQANLNLLANLNTQLDGVNQTLERTQQDKTFTQSALQQQIAAWQATQDGSNPETYDQQLEALQTELATLRSKYTDDYPDVIKAKHDIDNLNKKIAESDAARKSGGVDKAPKSTEPTSIQTLRAQIQQLDQVIKDNTEQQAAIQSRIKQYEARVEAQPRGSAGIQTGHAGLPDGSGILQRPAEEAGSIDDGNRPGAHAARRAIYDSGPGGFSRQTVFPEQWPVRAGRSGGRHGPGPGDYAADGDARHIIPKRAGRGVAAASPRAGHGSGG